VKSFKQGKTKRDQEKFDRKVKVELQSISASYQKEIETLRAKLGEADRQLTVNNRHKHMMQENLKKVFMRSVCALNFEAMTILDPAEQNFAQQKMEQELARQVEHAMMGNDYGTKSEVSFNLSEADHGTDREHYGAERDLMNIGLNMVPNNINQPSALDESSRKIESKDSMWKPAPIMGRERAATQNNQAAYQE